MFNLSVKFLRIFRNLLIFAAMVIILIYGADSRAAEPTGQGQAEWLIMIYQVADDETLEQDILIDLQEAEFIGSSDQIHIVAQTDRALLLDC